jgi:hypothetical protein
LTEQMKATPAFAPATTSQTEPKPESATNNARYCYIDSEEADEDEDEDADDDDDAPPASMSSITSCPVALKSATSSIKLIRPELWRITLHER